MYEMQCLHAAGTVCWSAGAAGPMAQDGMDVSVSFRGLSSNRECNERDTPGGAQGTKTSARRAEKMGATLPSAGRV